MIMKNKRIQVKYKIILYIFISICIFYFIRLIIGGNNDSIESELNNPSQTENYSIFDPNRFSTITPNDLLFKEPAGRVVDVRSHYAFTKNNDLFYLLIAYAQYGFLSQLQINYGLIPLQGEMFSKMVTCSTKEFEYHSNQLGFKNNCLDMEYEISNGNQTQVRFRFKKDSGIEGNLNFYTQDMGIQDGRDGISYVGNPDRGRFRKTGFIASDRTEGSIEFLNESNFNSIYKFQNSGGIGYLKLGDLPHLIFKELNSVYFRSEEYTLILSQYFLPNSYKVQNGKGYVIVYNKNNQLDLATNQFNFSLKDPVLDEESHYNQYGQLNLHLNDTQLGHSQSQLKGLKLNQVNLRKVQKMDVLEDLPRFLKEIVQTLITKPYIYQYYQPAELEIQTNSSSIMKIQGQLFLTSTYQ